MKTIKMLLFRVAFFFEKDAIRMSCMKNGWHPFSKQNSIKSPPDFN